VKRSARKFDRPAVFGRLRQKIGRRQDLWHVMLGFGDDLGELRDCLAQVASLRPSGNTIGSANLKLQDTT
jgi:hypothetical protein